MSTANPPSKKAKAGTASRPSLVLKRLLKSRGKSIRQAAAQIKQRNGKSLSKSGLWQIINHDDWPRSTPRLDIESQLIDYLIDIGVAKEHAAGAFALDSDSVDDSNDRLYNEIPEAEMLTQAAKKHFKLFVDPFKDDVQNADDVFLSTEQRYIRESMFAAAKHGGFIAIVGESGAGKSTLRRDLIDRIDRENQPITVIQPRIIDKGKLSAGGICDAIINDISREKPRRELEAKARQIERLLSGSCNAGNSHVLMIEEAHDLSITILKYLKRFWELDNGFKRLLSIVLVGQLELKAKLDERQNWDAREMIRRCEVAELLPLNGDLEDYVALKFRRINIDPASVLGDDSYIAMRERLTLRRQNSKQTVSMLYPLIVNNLITKAMNLAAEVGATRVTGEIIKEV